MATTDTATIPIQKTGIVLSALIFDKPDTPQYSQLCNLLDYMLDILYSIPRHDGSDLDRCGDFIKGTKHLFKLYGKLEPLFSERPRALLGKLVTEVTDIQKLLTDCITAGEIPTSIEIELSGKIASFHWRVISMLEELKNPQAELV